MLDLRNRILQQYNIDIEKENVFKLYGIANPNLTDDEIEESIEKTRKKWIMSANGSNERIAQRDKNRLAQAENYEGILRNKKLRKEVYRFYGNNKGGTGNKSNSQGSIAFAKSYFELVGSTKKIKKRDVEFFFKYFQKEEGRNKKAILQMLKEDFKVKDLGKEENYSENGSEGKTTNKNKSNVLVVNLFSESTILKVKKCFEKYEQVLMSNEITRRYPLLKKSLYDFLGIDKINTSEEIKNLFEFTAKDIFAIRQERGSEYIPLVDLYNNLNALIQEKDVIDNILEFKLLFKYSEFTPYMYAFVDMKPNTIKKLLEVANTNYAFVDETDFILNYYLIMYDNFGISNDGIKKLIKKANTKKTSNELKQKVYDKFGIEHNKRRMIQADILYWLMYWPILTVYFVFKVSKIIFTNLHKLRMPLFLLLVTIFNKIFAEALQMEDLFAIKDLLSESTRNVILNNYFGLTTQNGFEIFLLSLTIVVFLFIIYVLPALAGAFFVTQFSNDFNKRFDWIGIERTFKNVFEMLKRKVESGYKEYKNLYVKSKIPHMILNVINLLILIIGIHYGIM